MRWWGDVLVLVNYRIGKLLLLLILSQSRCKLYTTLVHSNRIIFNVENWHDHIIVFVLLGGGQQQYYHSQMAATFFLGFIFLSILVTWLLIRFASSLVALIAGRIVGASVKFRVGGWNCLRDVIVKFGKGAVESVSVGEIRFSLGKSLTELDVVFVSRDPKLQVLICKPEIILRTSNKGTQTSRSRKSGSSSKKSKKSGKGKWMVIANVAKLLSVSVTELVFKVRTVYSIIHTQV
ncbi:protein SABRE-like [Apium graveolens]|uniref:protein SABRE-like n=1 Tax=Apium graveolens TaxID=4045 RepID=UPI003D79987E